MKIKTYTKKDFAWTKWSEKDIKNTAKEIIKLKKERYSKIKNIKKEDRTFENTILALEFSDYDLSDKMGQIGVLSQASPSIVIRNAAHTARISLSSQLINIEYDEKIYKAVKDYADKKEKLIGVDKKLLKDMMLGYKRMGFNLNKGKREKLQKNIKELSKLSQTFSKNINDYKDYILVTDEEIDGLSDSYKKGLNRDKKTGKYKVTLEYPDSGPFMEKAKSSIKRKELSEKNSKKGGEKNLKIVKRVLKLRQENAKLLGYDTHADYVTEVRTVKSKKRALTFVNGLMKKIEKGVKKEISELNEIKQKQEGSKKLAIKHYDIAYYSDQLRQNKFSIDSEKIREYFPVDKVKKGTFEIYEKLFSIKFEKLLGFSLWHKDVELYAVKDGGKIISYFALDLYPREGKYGHACAMDVFNGRETPNKGEYTAPFAIMLSNFSKPRRKQPSLLGHSDVETFFHEFGHIMHMVLTKAKYSSQSGANTARDFVEAPSQMLEHWVWDKKMLNILSGHYKTNNVLPKEMIDNMLKAKFHMINYWVVRQLILALFDLKLHSELVENPTRLYSQLVKKHTGIETYKKHLFPAGFGHLMGYSAGYYGYMWAKVFGDDMFTRFKGGGLLNKKIGAEYRKHILEKGSSEEEMKLLERFLGRKPNNKAFLEEIGLQ